MQQLNFKFENYQNSILKTWDELVNYPRCFPPPILRAAGILQLGPCDPI